MVLLLLFFYVFLHLLKFIVIKIQNEIFFIKIYYIVFKIENANFCVFLSKLTFLFLSLIIFKFNYFFCFLLYTLDLTKYVVCKINILHQKNLFFVLKINLKIIYE